MMVYVITLTQVLVSIFLVWTMQKRYIEQHASIKYYVDNQLKALTAINADQLQQLIGPMNGTVATLKISVEKIIASQQGMENVTIKALEERLDKIERQLENHKSILKRVMKTES